MRPFLHRVSPLHRGRAGLGNAMARHKVTRRDFDQFRVWLLVAIIKDDGATGVKVAPFGWVGGAGQVAGDDDALTLFYAGGVWHRDS